MKKFKVLLITIFIPFSVMAGSGHEHNHGHGNDHIMESHAHSENESGVGRPAEISEVTKTVTVVLLDPMRFVFKPELTLMRDDVVNFVVINEGNIRHEFSIGSKEEQLEHRKMMLKMPDMVHQDANTITLEPGERKNLIWKFSTDESPVIACNIPGHTEAGMIKYLKLNK